MQKKIKPQPSELCQYGSGEWACALHQGHAGVHRKTASSKDGQEPLPWVHGNPKAAVPHDTYSVYTQTGKKILTCFDDCGFSGNCHCLDAEANAALIVRAVNSHTALVEAAERAHGNAMEQIEALDAIKNRRGYRICGTPG